MATIRIAITGAAGQIGYSLLPRIAAGEMFGSQTKIQWLPISHFRIFANFLRIIGALLRQVEGTLTMLIMISSLTPIQLIHPLFTIMFFTILNTLLDIV